PRRDVTAGMKSTGAAMGAWKAAAGEDLQTVLSRWSQTAGVDLQWQATNGGKVAQDFTHNGSFNDAVAALISENAASTGLQSQYQSGEAPAGPRANAPSYV